MTKKIIKKTRTVLVVDDDPAALDQVDGCLTPQGFRVLTVSRWTEAIEQIQENRPDLVLLDLYMPTVQGDALLEFIRGQEQDLPVVIVSAEIEQQKMEQLGKLGASGFIRKPFEEDDLLLVVEQVLTVHSGAPEEPAVSGLAGPEPVQETDAEADPLENYSPGSGATETQRKAPSPAGQPAQDRTEPYASDISPGAGVETLERRRQAEAAQAPQQVRKRRVRKRRPKRGHKLRNYVLTFVLCVLIGVILWALRETLTTGFFGIGINPAARQEQVR